MENIEKTQQIHGELEKETSRNMKNMKRTKPTPEEHLEHRENTQRHLLAARQQI